MENPLSFSPIRDVDVTFTSLNIISEALRPSTVGKFSLSIPSASASKQIN